MAELVEVTTRIGVVGDGGLASSKRPVLRHHAIARRNGHGPELLHLTLPTGGVALPLFSSGVMTQDFLASQGLDGAWYARECYAGELVSLLLGLYAGIDGVLLDPVHGGPLDGSAPENFVPWKGFVEYLLSDERGIPAFSLTQTS